MATFYKSDCLEQLRRFATASLDLIYFDPPFATTGNWWDEALDWPAIFTECFRALRPTGNLVIHCSIPFNYTLIRAAPRPPSYSWYWKKNIKTNYLNVNKQPLRQVEEILVWKMPKAVYYPQRVGSDERTVVGGNSSTYFEGGEIQPRTSKVKGFAQTHLLDYPIALDTFSTRPREILELMLKSYTKAGDVVCDLTCYKGVSGIVCRDLGRRWIGVDKYHFPTLLLQSLTKEK